MSKDKIQGMFIGHALGDALGLPHEFRCNEHVKFTGKLQYKPKLDRRYQGTYFGEIGQVSDDTEMTLIILKSIIKFHGIYNKRHVLQEYLNWANDKRNFYLGRNTRSLFKGVKTIKGYEKRFKKKTKEEHKKNQSNGALMRCSPLALIIKHLRYSIVEDCSLTNKNTICLMVNWLYCIILSDLYENKPVKEIFKRIVNIVDNTTKYNKQYKDDLDRMESFNSIFKVLKQAENKEKRNIDYKKGWCLHALYCAVYCLLYFDQYHEAMKWIIDQKGDTDTNAAISGAVMGMKLGLKEMQKDETTKENIKILLSCNPNKGGIPKDKKYIPNNLLELSDEYHEIISKSNKRKIISDVNEANKRKK